MEWNVLLTLFNSSDKLSSKNFKTKKNCYMQTNFFRHIGNKDFTDSNSVSHFVLMDLFLTGYAMVNIT